MSVHTEGEGGGRTDRHMLEYKNIFLFLIIIEMLKLLEGSKIFGHSGFGPIDSI